MSATQPVSEIATHFSFSSWVAYFQNQAHWKEELPWDDPYRLSPEERDAVSASLQQFQLGEGSDGSGLNRRGQQLVARCRDQSYVEALTLFIAEERRHSHCLGCFMDQQQIPRLQTHWVDTVFRRVRRIAGLELCIRVLVTAEIIAVPFYQALSQASNSKLLQAICERFLLDEHQHLRFQAATLARLRDDRGALSHHAWKGFHACLLALTSLLVWRQYKRTLSRGGYTMVGFLQACWSEYHQVQRWVQEALHLPKPILLPGELEICENSLCISPIRNTPNATAERGPSTR